MNKFKCISLLLALTLSTLPVSANDSGVYQIDPVHSHVGFEVPHLVISSVEGKFKEFSGTIEINEKTFSKSKVEATIKVSSIDTGTEKRDNHLKSKDFFEVETYPDMKFVSQKISGNKKKFTMTGQLTIKGKTRTVTFSSKFLGTVKDGYGNLKAAFVAETEVNRKDFGLTWNSMVEAGPVVGDDVKITLKVQAAKAAPQKQANLEK
ncbi:MAG: YceI family protein [Bdellovibrionales bacterium]|nr:YceI family protein [Bdellovibrionales bacterium]